MSKLILYRGDSNKIKEFKYKETNKYCLLGQGIYLTNKESVAHTYRTKGTRESNKEILFSGQSDNRATALEEGFYWYCIEKWKEDKGCMTKYPTDPKQKKKFEDPHRLEYSRLIEKGDIVASYTDVIGMVQYKSQKVKRSLKVVWTKPHVEIGYVTRFEFEEDHFNKAMFHVDQPCYDTTFWTLVYNNGMFVGTPRDNLSDYVKENTGKKVMPSTIVPGLLGRVTRPNWLKLQRLLRPLGYLGFEYDGGVRLGGGHRHRAFCVWDENFVNEHKVERFK